MKRAAFLVLAVAATCLGSCRRMDLRTVVIHVPEMKNDACVTHVEKALSRVPGVHRERTQFDLKTRTVLVTYESLNLSLKNIEFAIAEAGFAANEVPANKKAIEGLPPACR